jgi:hypothetical protein
MDICANRLKTPVLSAVDHQRPVASLKEMAEHPMPRIEPLRVGPQKPLHPVDQVRLRDFQQGVVMIAHQHVGMDRPTRLAAGLIKRLQGKLASSSSRKISRPWLPRLMTW